MSKVKYEIRRTPEMEFVGACKDGEFGVVAELLENGSDPNTKALVWYKNRLLGLKWSNDWGKYIMTHQSEDRLMGSALHYCVMGGRHEVLGLLLAFGASPLVRLNLPPHMPHEVTVEELATKQNDEITPKLITFFRVWSVLPPENDKKLAMLAKLPAEVEPTLKPYLEAMVHRQRSDPSLNHLKRAVAPNEEPPQPPETAALLKDMSS
eukprot:TRINITY_DN1566_c0_g1_i1.p1 TRINITY_DN1566_c0_g1~~TRINITY_DN1566_c0_g1_i1.p1  ORF type:complete len:220 (+),score=58.78 TRINITY_DN1566_c0_g1_i1:39-662(+)